MKKGVSPIIATVLLIGIVVVIALIISVWLFGFIGDSVVKNGRAIELSCEEVSFEAEIFEGSLDVVNRGDVPIYGFEVKLAGKGDTIVTDVIGSTIGQGGRHSIILVDHQVYPKPGEEYLIVPVILGETQTGKRVAYSCSDEHGVEGVV